MFYSFVFRKPGKTQLLANELEYVFFRYKSSRCEEEVSPTFIIPSPEFLTSWQGGEISLFETLYGAKTHQHQKSFLSKKTQYDFNIILYFFC